MGDAKLHDKARLRFSQHDPHPFCADADNPALWKRAVIIKTAKLMKLEA